MSRSLTRISLVLVFLLSSEVWAIGLGDIQLDSALNEPLRAEIELLSATPEELAGLSVSLASAETFARYGIDRPFYLQELAFNVESGPNGAVIQVRSASPITEPFLTFLVEATWSAGRLLREYTVLLDPPTYSPPAIQQRPAVEAPQRAAPTDSGRIERQPPEPRPEPQPEPRPTYTPPSTPAETPAPSYEEAPAPAATPTYEAPYSTTVGGDYYVERGDTLWGITSRLRPDSRVSMNQTMIAIFEANPQAFEGNINRLKANVTLRIPSADDVFQISRGDAFSAVQRMNAKWRGDTAVADATYDDTAYEDTAAEDTGYDTGAGQAAEAETETSLVLVPPDEEPAAGIYDESVDSTEAPSREQEIMDRIGELEAADVPNQQSLIEIRDNELAALRQELADIRGEVYEPPVTTEGAPADDLLAGDDIQAEDDLVAADTGEGVAAEEEAAEAEERTPTNVIRTTRVSEPGIMDRITGILGNIWTKIIAALLVVAGILLWFVRRGRSDEDDGSWDTRDRDDIAAGAMSATETMAAPTPDESFVVVEQDSGIRPIYDHTLESLPPEIHGEAPAVERRTAQTDRFDSLEDTFSSDTAVNLDQTDPIAEADFHMAYGLYDQAAALIMSALESEPNDKTLMAKLCEIYFVWGNRDAFIDAASSLKSVIGDYDSAKWDKIVIMGQQIAADHELFAGAEVAGATRAIDLSFDSEADDAGALDMDFGAAETGESEVVDLGAAEDVEADADLDFLFDEEGATTEAATEETPPEEPTAEMPAPAEPTIETPVEETAEINLDELDLDVKGLDESKLESPDDGDISDTMDDLYDPGATGLRLAPDETGRMPTLDSLDETDSSAESDLLDVTGGTEVLSEDLTVDADSSLGDDEPTRLASLDEEDEAIGEPGEAETLHARLDDDEDYGFASTEALPADALTSDDQMDESSEIPAVAGTDLDLDLDDLSAALQLSGGGDTVQQLRDDATVEQPRPPVGDETAEEPTMSIGPDDMSEDLHEARTMTEVGTKLDLARAYVDMGDPAGARSILEEVLDEGDEGQRQQAQQLLDSLPG